MARRVFNDNQRIALTCKEMAISLRVTEVLADVFEGI
jgi:hypothetical protein